MRLIKASIDINDLIKNQYSMDCWDWEDIFEYNEFTQEKINKLCANVKTEDFWGEITRTNYVNNIDVKYFVQYQENVFWEAIVQERNPMFTKTEINYLCNNVNNNSFWYNIFCDKYIYSIDVKYLVEHQDKLNDDDDDDVDGWIVHLGGNNEVVNHVNWETILQNGKFNEQEIKYLCDNISNLGFWKYIFPTGYIDVKNVDVKFLVQHQDKVPWFDILNNRIFTNEEKIYLDNNITNENCLDLLNLLDIQRMIQKQDEVHWSSVIDGYNFSTDNIIQLCNNVKNEDFWKNITSNFKYIDYIDIKSLINYQNFVNWWIIHYRTKNPFNKDEINDLCDNVKNKDFWNEIIHSQYVDRISIQYLVQYQDRVAWVDIFNNREFTKAEKKYLCDNVTNNEFLKIFNTKEKVSKMSYQELINNRNAINWENIDLKDLLNVSENEKKLLLTRIPGLGVKYAEDISDDFSQIKEKPIKQFFTLGNRDMHGSRTGAFVVVKDGNNPVEVLFEPGGSHDIMLRKMARKYDYDSSTMVKLMNVEAGLKEISSKMDLDTEAEKELEYAKEHLHCCCGYVHVDENNENPIAVMDATRVYNFSPQEVARILQGKKYDGKEIIAFGINDAGASSIAFMKVAKITKKRLISHNYRILYWYNNGC